MADERTFYCVMEGKGSNQTVGFGGSRRVDASGKVLFEPYKEIRFREGKFTTNDPELIAWLEKACHDSATGVMENYETYLAQLLGPERNADRLAAQNKELRETNNRLLEQLKSKKQPATADRPAHANA